PDRRPDPLVDEVPEHRVGELAEDARVPPESAPLEVEPPPDLLAPRVGAGREKDRDAVPDRMLVRARADDARAEIAQPPAAPGASEEIEERGVHRVLFSKGSRSRAL